MKNALNNQVGMLDDMFLWLVANLKQGVIYFIKQACGNDILASVYVFARRLIFAQRRKMRVVQCQKYLDDQSFLILTDTFLAWK